MGSVFRRRKDGNPGEGDVCPYCEFVNEEGVENCAQCYYSMNLAPRDQPMATPTTTGSELLNTLMEHAEFEEDEVAVEAVLSLDDVSVEIDQYDNSAKEEEDTFQFISGSSPTLSQTVEFEKPQVVELEVSDAPSDAVMFDMGDEDPLGVEMEPVHSGLGKLYSPSVKTESDDDLMGTIGPIASQEPLTPELPSVANIAQPLAKNTLENPLPAPAMTPEVPAVTMATPLPQIAQAVATVPLPMTPEIPAAGLSETPTTPDIPVVEEPKPQQSTPDLPSTQEVKPAQVEPVAAPTPEVGKRIWPWPAQEPWDARQVYREVVALLEFIKVGQLQKAADTIDSLGPHLEHNLDMLLHIGSAMRALNREEHLQWTLAMAKHVHPNNEHVAAAITQLS